MYPVLFCNISLEILARMSQMCGRSDYLKMKIARAALVIKKNILITGGTYNDSFETEQQRRYEVFDRIYEEGMREKKVERKRNIR